MKEIRERLRASRGETLVETLMAMLIVSLSSALLATMIATAVSINRSAMASDKTHYAQMTAAQTSSADVGTAQLTISGTGLTTSTQYNVALRGASDGLRSYQKEGP